MGKQLLNTEKAVEIKDSLLDVILKSDELLNNESVNMSDDGRKTLMDIRAATTRCLSDIRELPEDNTAGWIQALETVSVEMGKALFSACLRNLEKVEFSDIAEVLKKLTDVL